MTSHTPSEKDAVQIHRHQHHHRDVPHALSPAAAAAAAAQPDAGSLHPGAWRPYEHRKLANPAPLGLCAFALTTFVLSAINMHARDISAPNVVVPLAFGYGGLVQLLAGMWSVALFFSFSSKSPPPKSFQSGPPLTR